jgi:hypothetical protein
MALCTKCRKNEGNPYMFYYGNKVSESSSGEKTNAIGYTTRTVRKQYKVAGSQVDVVCDSCIHKRERNNIVGGFVGGFLLAVVFIRVFLLYFREQPGWFTIVYCLNTIVFFVTIYLFKIGFEGAKRSPQEYGEKIALQLNKKKLEAEHSEFWTATEFLDMKTKTGG